MYPDQKKRFSKKRDEASVYYVKKLQQVSQPSQFSQRIMC